jgi:Protein of unknown function (DUF664)
LFIRQDAKHGRRQRHRERYALRDHRSCPPWGRAHKPARSAPAATRSGRLEVGDVPDDVLGVVATPTGMGLHGLVRHLTNVERSWLRDVFAGEEGLVFDWTEADPDAEWRVPEGTTVVDLLGDYAAESRRCDAVVMGAASLDAVSAHRDMSLRWILLHLVEETARHLGHIDLLRELADGSTGEEPTQ